MNTDNIASQPLNSSPFTPFYGRFHRPTLEKIQDNIGTSTLISAGRFAVGVVAKVPARTSRRWAQKGISQRELALFAELDGDQGDIEEQLSGDIEEQLSGDIEEQLSGDIEEQLSGDIIEEPFLLVEVPQDLPRWVRMPYYKAKKRNPNFGTGTAAKRVATCLALLRACFPDDSHLPYSQQGKELNNWLRTHEQRFPLVHGLHPHEVAVVYMLAKSNFWDEEHLD